MIRKCSTRARLTSPLPSPRMKYKGSDGSESVRPQCIRRPAHKRPASAGQGKAGGPIITELQSTETEAPALPLRVSAGPAGTSGRAAAKATAHSNGPSAADAAAAPAYSRPAGPQGLVQLPPPAWRFEGRPVSAFSAAWDVPKDLSDSVDVATILVEVRAAPAEVSVTVPGCRPVSAPMPFHAAPHGARAALEGGALTVTFALLPVDDVVRELKGRAPHELGSLQLSSLAAVDDLA